MKKILITDANSYIGTSFERYITENFPEQYKESEEQAKKPTHK